MDFDIFGRNVTDKVGNQKTPYYATANNLCFCTASQNGETRKSHFHSVELCYTCNAPMRCIPETKVVKKLFDYRLYRVNGVWEVQVSSTSSLIYETCAVITLNSLIVKSETETMQQLMYERQLVDAETETSYTRYNRLSNRLSNGFDNRFDNRLYRVNGAWENK